MSHPEVGVLHDIEDQKDFNKLPWKLRVDGEAVGAYGGATYESLDPSTGESLATVPDAGAPDLEEAYIAGHRAQEQWRNTPLRERAALVVELADALQDHSETFAIIDARDSGNPLSAMRRDVALAVDSMKTQAGLSLSIRGEAMDGGATHLHYTRNEPFGVVGRIVAYNHPILYAAARTVPAFLAGNAVILKPAPQTPLSALMWGEVVDAILPPGLLSVLTGSGGALGAAIVEHPGIRRIAFTGSAGVGRAIQENAARAAVKSISLELGGKNPMIVFPEADLAAAAEGAFLGMNFNSVQGQSCGSTSRVLVHTSCIDEFIRGLAEHMLSLRVGHAMDEASNMGPLISEEHRARVNAYIDRATSDGAQAVIGSSQYPSLPEQGFFVNPSLLSGVTSDMTIAREEVFGPVVCLIEFSTEEEAIALANDSQYGLTASVWTSDLRRAHRVARELDVGYVWVNETASHYPGVPFGGVKDSGIGREESVEEILSYSQLKSVNVRL